MAKLEVLFRNKNLLSEILDIEETDNEDMLFQAFVEQYG